MKAEKYFPLLTKESISNRFALIFQRTTQRSELHISLVGDCDLRTRSRHWTSNRMIIFIFYSHFKCTYNKIKIKRWNSFFFTLSRRKPEVANKHMKFSIANFSSRAKANAKWFSFQNVHVQASQSIEKFSGLSSTLLTTWPYTSWNCAFHSPLTFGIDMWFLIEGVRRELACKKRIDGRWLWVSKWKRLPLESAFNRSSMMLSLPGRLERCIKLNRIITGPIELNFNLALNWDALFPTARAPCAPIIYSLNGVKSFNMSSVPNTKSRRSRT